MAMPWDEQKITKDVNFNGNYATQLQNIAALATKGAGYYFRGGTDHIIIADHANLSFGNGATDKAFSIVTRISPAEATTFPVIGKGVYNTSGEWRLLIDSNDKINFQLFDESVANCYIGRKYNTALTGYEGKDLEIVATYDGSGASSGIKIYIGGNRVDDADADNVPGSYVAMENLAADVHICRDDTNYGKGHGFAYYIFNLELTSDEAKDVFSVPFKYFGASQTLITPEDDCADDDTANWTDVNGALSDNGTEYTYTVTTGASVASFTDEAALTIGKRYRATVQAKDGTGAGATVRIRALTNAGVEIVSGAAITVAAGFDIASVEWTATEADNKVQIEIAAASVADGETVKFDEIECNTIGCVLQLEQTGIGTAKFMDNSGNAHDGAVTGAIATNIPLHIILPLTNDAVTPTLAFGDGDTGFYESGDDSLAIAIGGNLRWIIKDSEFESGNTRGISLRRVTGSATTPPYAINDDENTGIGSPAADQLSLIAGGVEGIRITETTAKMAEKFGCNALGGVGRVAFSATANITADHTITIQVNIPSGAKILGVQMRVDVALAGGETWNAQYVTGATQAIATAQAVAQNTKVNKIFDENAATAITSGETDITITKNSNPGVDVFTAQGTIRAVVYYEDWTTLGDV